jgi:hypothetical protein
MDFDHFEAPCQSKPSGRGPSLDIVGNTAFIQLDGNRISISEGNGAWADNRPAGERTRPRQ